MENEEMENEEIEQIKSRLARLEEEVFGMDYEKAQRVVDSYLEATEKNPNIPATDSVFRAERLLGV